MNEDPIFIEALENMEQAANALSQLVRPPQFVSLHGNRAFRYVEKSPLQSIVQKLARMVSSLSAAHLLMKHGFVQEQGAMQRILDELNEDITFLSYAIIFDKWSELHDRFLEAFYEEEFDANSAIASTQRRKTVTRGNIRAWISNAENGMDPSSSIELSRTISKAYSGYVHAASPHIMDMFGGNPPRFHMRGMVGTPRHGEHRADIWNYFYRGILSCAFAAKAFGAETMFADIRQYAADFERASGKDYQSKAWDGI